MVLIFLPPAQTFTDKNEGSEELMSAINNAYEVLMGDLSRKQYDRTLKL